MGRDPLTGRHTLAFNRSHLMLCNMDWSTDKKCSIDNLQVFVVLKSRGKDRKRIKMVFLDIVALEGVVDVLL